MNNDWFLNSVSVLAENWKLILALLVCVSWGTLLTFATLKKISAAQFTDAEMTALALGGFPLPMLIISALMLALRLFISHDFISIITFAFLIISAGFAIRVAWKYFSPNISIPVFMFLFLVFVRLGFAAHVILPPYFDSAEHYRIIQSLINMDKVVLETPYYHLGYHMIVAAFTWITHENPGQVILLFGQVLLAAIPFPIYFLVHRATHSNTAAWFGVTLAAFGWFMPAHAVNWGKYPALLSLLLIQFTLGVALAKNRWLFTLSLIASALIHSRSIILLTIFGTAWILSRVSHRKQILFFALAGTMLGVAILLINQNQTIGVVFDPYGVWVTLLVALLAVFAFQSFSTLMVSSILAMLLTLFAMLVPITSILTLLDRPLVEMTLFLPLAFLGGLGATRLPKFVVILFAAFIIFHAWTTYNSNPSTCCQLVSRDDASALNWMDSHLPADARVAIPNTDLRLSAFGSPMMGTGADAGIWVVPLTARAIFALPYSTDFTTQSTHDLLCQQQVTHIYVGGLPRSFQFAFGDEKPAWYETIFSLPDARVIRTLGCK